MRYCICVELCESGCPDVNNIGQGFDLSNGDSTQLEKFECFCENHPLEL
jgi:hypothetical protein